jgi:long-chain acyl-CoA synthetase
MGSVRDTRLATLHDLIARFGERGDDPAVVTVRTGGGVDSLAYAALHEEVMQLAAGLSHSGLCNGALVLLWAPNSPAWVSTYLAIVAAGNIVVPLDDQATIDVLQVVLGKSTPACIFTVTGHLDALREAGASSDLPRYLLDTGADDGRSWRSLFVPGASRAAPAADERSVAALLYTSGTTGTPKGVPLTHANLLSNVRGLLAAGIISDRDRVLLPLPLHHAYPATVGMLCVLACGAAMVLPSGVTGPELSTAANRAGATILIGVPRLYTALVEAILGGIRARNAVVRTVFGLMLRAAVALRRTTGINAGRVAFRSLHRRVGDSLRLLASGGARLDAEIAWQLEGLGWQVLTGYGLTETSPVVTFNAPDQRRIETQGRALAEVELRIMPAANEDHGEILVKGPNVFSGYWQDEQATRRAFTPDGWFRTGDDGFLDQDGFLHVLGRGSEVIVLPDGKKIAPEELERRYESSPYIREVALLERAGSLLALVVPDDDAIRRRGAMSASTLVRDELDVTMSGLPPYQRLRDYRLLRQPLPRTRLGKLRRHLLPALADASAAREISPAAGMADDDRKLLAAAAVAPLWRWLAERYRHAGITLDSSPQLDLGIDSLGWVSLTAEIEDRFGVSLNAGELVRVLTVRDLLRAVDAASRARAGGGDRQAPLADAGEKYLKVPGPALRLLRTAIVALVRLTMHGPFRLRIRGRQHLPREGAFVIAPSHTSYLDPLAVAAALPRSLLRRVCWAGWIGKTHKGPLWRAVSRSMRIFPVNPDQDLGQSIRLAVQVLQAGDVLVWFPEGRRSRDGRLQPFRPGIGALLEQEPVPVVPARIDGSFAAWPPQRKWPRFRPITITFGEPRSSDWLSMHGRGADAAARISDGLGRCVADLERDA